MSSQSAQVRILRISTAFALTYSSFPYYWVSGFPEVLGGDILVETRVTERGITVGS
jgi:hypothetical protein